MARTSEHGGATLDPIIELQPLPRFSRGCINVKDAVFPFCLTWTVQEEVVGVGKGEVWNRRE
jgi:hypothetical protein